MDGLSGSEIIISHTTLNAIHRHVEHARVKHEWPVGYPDADKYRAAEKELHEVAAAMLKGDRRGVRQEALDCLAVLVRIVEGDGEPGKGDGKKEEA